MPLNANLESFLSLVRLGVGHSRALISDVVDWQIIKELAEKEGLSAIVVDSIECLPEEKRPPKVLLLEWIGTVLQAYEYRYELYQKTIAELATFYNSHGYKMMVLKGYACSLNWPKPEHRPCGDIDIWQFGQQKDADKALNAWFKVQGSKFKIDNSHHHHTVFEWKGFTVENHYDFVNVHAEKSSKELEKIFKQLGTDDSHSVEVKHTLTGSAAKVYLPSPNLHALFLIRHMVSHFAAAEISLRQVLDWAFFVKKHTKEIDWDWLVSLLDQYHMKEFFNCINAICVEDLGFETNFFPYVQFSPELKNRVLTDILEPAFTADEPGSLIPRMVYKYRRWKGNAWKQSLCYRESRWSMFWMGIWAKLLKPASI